MIEVETFTKDFDLELKVEIELSMVIQLDQEMNDVHQPWVGWSEHRRSCTLRENFADKRNDNGQSFGIMSFDEKLLERNVLVLDRPIASQCQEALPSTEIFHMRSVRGVLHRCF